MKLIDCDICLSPMTSNKEKPMVKGTFQSPDGTTVWFRIYYQQCKKCKVSLFLKTVKLEEQMTWSPVVETSEMDYFKYAKNTMGDGNTASEYSRTVCKGASSYPSWYG